MMALLRYLVVVVGLSLATYSAYLITLKKIHLGIVLPLIIGGAMVIYGIFYQQISHHLQNHPWLHTSFKIATGLFGLWLLSVLVFFMVIYQHTKKQPTHHQNLAAIIVLGSKAHNGIPSPALANRLDVAATLKEQNPNAYLITTGGVGFGETISEADAAKSYLIHRHHINSQHILSENQSTSTELNLSNSVAILNHRHLNKHSKIAIVTSDFHTLRTQKIAQKQGFDNTVVIAAPTPLQTRYHAWLREYFALISGFLLKEY